MRILLGLTIFSTVYGQAYEYDDYNYDASIAQTTVDLGPDNRKQEDVSDYEKGGKFWAYSIRTCTNFTS